MGNIPQLNYCGMENDTHLLIRYNEVYMYGVKFDYVLQCSKKYIYIYKNKSTKKGVVY